ncbi:MAG: DUF839 domain-containing protein [Cyanobacteria bacterium REEB65]|nr:DUF839 domain-containing protein [Cyanobacteria bacterium REEB65]
MPPIVGSVRWAPADPAVQHTQALLTDVANGATISLIDASTGATVATTVTAANGSFNLTLSSWVPSANTPYFLEAVKGLPAGGSANRAGAAAARVRTMIAFQMATWVNLSNSASVLISPGTTAMCVIAYDSGLTAAQELGLMGSINTSSGFAGNSTISLAAYSQVQSLVNDALAADEDPIAAIAYDSTGASPATQFALKPANVVIDAEVTPTVINPGGTATFFGQNLPGPESTPSIMIGQLPVATWSVNASRSALTVTLPANGYSGLLNITDGQGTWTGPFLGVHGTVGTLAGAGIAGYADGVGSAALFNFPDGLAIDPAGNLVVAEGQGNHIRRISPNGVVTTVAGNGMAADTTGSGTAASIDAPYGVAVDATGNIFTASQVTNLIRKVSTAGLVTTFAGSGAATEVNGTGTSASFNEPTGVAVDTSGNVYVSDWGGQTIRKITSAGTVSTLAGNGSVGLVNGAGSSAEFWQPYHIAVDSSGNVWVADQLNFCIREINPSGSVSTFAGGSTSANIDGTGVGAAFAQPMGIAIDTSGKMWVADEIGPAALREMTSAGVVTTVAGNKTSGFVNGTGTAVQFGSELYDVAAANGEVYMADPYNNCIRVYTP